jgi:hypothetical protein
VERPVNEKAVARTVGPRLCTCTDIFAIRLPEVQSSTWSKEAQLRPAQSKGPEASL